jgi:hypothetical protein
MRLISTTQTSKTDPTGGLTLKALQDRRRALAEQTPQAPAQIASPWQGAAYMADSFVNALQQKSAEAKDTAGRQALAQALMRQDPMTGDLPPDAMATALALDPEAAMRIKEHVMSYRQQQAQQQAGWEHDKAVLDDQRRYDEAHGTKFEVDPTDPTGRRYIDRSGKEPPRYLTPPPNYQPSADDPTKIIDTTGQNPPQYVVQPSKYEQAKDDPTKFIDVSGRNPPQYVQAPSNWVQDQKDPTLWHDPTGKEPDRYVSPPSRFERDKNNPNLYNDTTGQSAPQLVEPRDPKPNWEKDPTDPTGQRYIDTTKQNPPEYPAPKTGGSGITVTTNADGTTTTTVGGPGPGKVTEAQGNIANYYARAAGSADAIDKGEQVLTQLGPRIPLLAFGQDSPLGQMASNVMAGPEYQVAQQGASDFVTAFLRRESGAAIQPSEWVRYNNLFIPQPGDKPEKIAAKRRARAIAMEGMKAPIAGTPIQTQIDDAIAKINDPTYQPGTKQMPAEGPVRDVAATPTPAQSTLAADPEVDAILKKYGGGG